MPDPPPAVGPLLRLERSRLVSLLRSLDPSEWSRPTRCPGWSVHDLVLHLVGDDMSQLSWHRDGHRGASPPDGIAERGFISWLDDLQIGWVDAARRLSPRLAIDLLEWMDEPLIEIVAAQDPAAVTAHVSWASTGLVPMWLDHVRELSERWIHRQQLLDALDRPVDLDAELLAPILDGLRLAYPFRLSRAPRPAGTSVLVSVTGPEVRCRWSLLCDGHTWRFDDDERPSPAAAVDMSTDQIWRLLTNNLERSRHGEPTADGEDELVEVLLGTRAIIGLPK